MKLADVKLIDTILSKVVAFEGHVSIHAMELARSAVREEMVRLEKVRIRRAKVRRETPHFFGSDHD